MTEKQIQKIIDDTVDATIRKLKDAGLLKDSNDVAYQEITARLRQYFKDGETDTEVTEALNRLSDDPYSKAIFLYFRYGYTLEGIADSLGVDVSTVTRNKRRISLALYEILEG